MKDNKKGFTLIELLAVIAILAILMLLVTPRLVKSIKSSKKDTFYDNVTLIYNTAILEYVDDNTKNNEYCDTCSNNLGNKIPNKFEYKVKFEDDKLIYIKITDKDYIYIKNDSNGINKGQLDKDDIKEYDPNEFYGDTLAERLFFDNPIIKERKYNEDGTLNDFKGAYTSENINTLFKSTESIGGNTPKEVYYFAGDAKNNWVKFGTYQDNGPIWGHNGAAYFYEFKTMTDCENSTTYSDCDYAWKKGEPMYWRIVRTNADGSIKLLYAGESTTTTTGHIGSSAYESTILGGKRYIGYMYGFSDADMKGNQVSSTVKIKIDTWYKKYLKNKYSNYLSNDAVYCNDRTLGKKYNSDYANFGYLAYDRFEGDVVASTTTKEKANPKPTYDCADIKDAFSGNNSYAKLICSDGIGICPLAMITADEIAYAGGYYNGTEVVYNKIWYSKNNKKSGDKRVTGAYMWDTMTPLKRQTGDNMLLLLSFTGNLRTMHTVKSVNVVRPVTSLKSCVTWKSGDGSADNPYEIVENGGC